MLIVMAIIFFAVLLGIFFIWTFSMGKSVADELATERELKRRAQERLRQVSETDTDTTKKE